MQTLPRSLFLAPPDTVARLLLGKLLRRRWQGAWLTGRIVETEAYFGTDDPAAHSSAGRTARNAVLWGPPAHAYVYFIYGMYSCLNVSCEPGGLAGCVLLRALEPLDGLPTMAALRRQPATTSPRLLTGGPGRLCQALSITRANTNGVDLLHPDSDLQLFAPEIPDPAPEIRTTPRIGIRKAADRPLRFLLANNPCVSGPRVP